jgi:TM2 domain-containing membrane protein YozV
VATKSAGIAVLLSFLWPGLGHLYIGQIGAGVALICAELGMVMFSFLIITLIVTVPVGVALLVVAATTAASAAQNYRPSGLRGA